MDKEVVLVTGSSRGIGSEIVREFAKNGYDVVINYNRSENEAEALANEIRELYGVETLTVKADVSKEDEVQRMIADVYDRFSKIDVLVNNAAIENTCEFFDKDKESFESVLATNLIGPFMVSKLVGKEMLERKKGKIINISSNNAINKYDSSTVEYDASKAGLNILTKVMAKELAPFVNVNAVAPGWVLTEKNKKLDQELNNLFISEESKNICLKRFAEPKEIASVVLFLASDGASYINGEIIVVDGGC